MARKSRKNVGLIGLGIIGNRIAAGLRAAGYHVFVWNRSPKPAPNFVGSPREVAEICEIIQIFVADAQSVREVVEAFGDQLTPKHIIINCATIGPEATVDIAQLVQGRGAAFLDAPFTGSKGAAEKAQLVYYVGGEEDVFLRARPVLEATSKAIVRCGRVGDAATLKVATNLITAVTTQTLAEALAIVRGAGIAPEALAAALEHNACKSGVVEMKLPKMIAGDYEPHFSVKHMFKDVQLGIHIANQQKLEIPLTTVVGGVLYGALCNGWGDLDFASLYRVYSDLPATPEPPAALPTAPAAESKPEAAATETPAPAPPAVAAVAPVSPEEKPPVLEVPPVAPTEKSETGTVTPVSEPASAETPAGEKPPELPKVEEPPVTPAEPPVAAVSAEADKPAEPKPETAEAAKVEAPATPEAIAADAPKAEEAKADGAVSSEKKAEDPAKHAPAADQTATPEKPTAPAEGGPDEESGLTGFFSRVFRRKGTPVGK